MKPVFFAVPGDLDTPTGGYAYARHLLRDLPAQDVAIRHLPLPGSYPHPSPDDIEEARRRLKGIGKGALLLIDGLAYGAMPEELIGSLDHSIVALVHHPLGLENGLEPSRRDALMQSEKAALARAAHVIVTSKFTGELLVEKFDVDQTRLTVAEPGTEPAIRAKGKGFPVSLLAVGAVSERKGYGLLVEALRDLTTLNWTLTIAGATDRNPGETAALQEAIARSGLSSRIRLAGAVTQDQLHGLYETADIFVSPSLFEGYGMVLTEALARGLPLVLSTGGAAGETVPDAAGLKVAPGDVEGLRQALSRAIENPELRETLAEASWQAGQKLLRWSETARRVAQCLKELRT